MMSERTIYIRSDPLRVVVKPNPFAGGANAPRTNLLPAESMEAATEHANKLNAQFGWPVVDETV